MEVKNNIPSVVYRVVTQLSTSSPLYAEYGIKSHRHAQMPMHKIQHLHHAIPNTEPPSNKHTLHNHTTSLLKLPHNPRQHSIDNLLHLILLLLRLLLVMCLLTRILVGGMLRRLMRRIWRHHGLAPSEVHVDPAGIFLGGILQAQFATDLLNARLDFLDVSSRVVTLADDAGNQLVQAFSSRRMNTVEINIHMQMVLPMRLGILNALFEDILRLLNKLPMQINRISRYTPIGVIFAEDKLRRLLVVLVHLAPMGLALLGKLLCARAIAALVGFS